MAIAVRDLNALDFNTLDGVVIQGTSLSDMLDDLRAGYFDPGTDDTIYGYGGADFITVHNGNDTVFGGNDQDFIIDSGTGNDKLYGEAASDHFVVGAGYDLIDGGDDIDSVSYAESQTPVALDLETGFAIADGIDTLVSIENVTGSSANDRIFGSAIGNSIGGLDGDDYIEGRGGDDVIFGEAGNDTLDGGEGINRLIGGPGHDVLIGAGGSDFFTFISWADFDLRDTIKNFQQGRDLIDVRQIDASANYAGNQRFNFDPTPDSWFEEFQDAFNDAGAIVTPPGPTIRGEPGEIEYKHENGNTYIFLPIADIETEWSIVLEGTYNLTSDDFLL
jgi:Ca2+-binding RTX toxin-like protein